MPDPARTFAEHNISAAVRKSLGGVRSWPAVRKLVSELGNGYASDVSRFETPRGAQSLVRRAGISGALAFGAGLALFIAVGGLRLWPRISGQHLPFALIWPFARPLLAAGLELSFLVSLPIALGVSASLRTARARGVASWRATAVSTVLLVVALGALSFGVSASLESGGSSPGQLAAELVASARQSCVESGPTAEVNVPLLGFSWLCERARAPLLRGRAPIGKQARFEAAAIELSDDLKRISLDHLKLDFSTPTFPVQIHAEHATLSGLPPWGRSRRMPFGLRSGLFVLSAGLSAYGVGRLAARTQWLPAWAGALVGASVSGCLWFALSWLERQEPAPLTYLALPAAGFVGLVATGLGLAVGRRAWLRWGRSLQAPESG